MRYLCLGLFFLAVASPLLAQEHQHDAPAPAQDADAHAEHALEPPPPAGIIPDTPAPPPPNEFAAERFYAPTAMAMARAQLRQEHGGQRVSSVMLRIAEYQGADGDGYRWDAEAWSGSDINRLVFKSEGEGGKADGVEGAELQMLYSRAVGVYTDLQFGVRQDFEPSRSSYVTAGFQTLLPYWFDVEGALFLSHAGELLGRIEGTYDARITNRWILQPRVELTVSGQDSPKLQTGSGLAVAEVGLRLRYEIRREFAPYAGISWNNRLGRTGDYARAAGKDDRTTRFVIGIRTFF